MHNFISVNKINKTPAVSAGVLLFILQLSFHSLFAQGAMVLNDFEHNANFTDVNGKPFVNPNIDVAGTTFFLEAWKYGKLKINDKTIFGNIRLRLDLKTQEIHFLKSDNIEMVAPAGTIKEITLLDSSNIPPSTYIFQSGFPPIDNQQTTNFYLLVCSGKINLLKSMRKTIHQDKDDYSGETRKEFRLYEDYYLYSGITLQRIKKDKTFLVDLMGSQREKVEAFIKSNNLSYKSIDDIKKIIDYYNALPIQ